MILRSDIAIAGIERRGYAQLAGERRAVGLAERLHVVFRLLGDDDAIDEDPGNLHLPRVERSALGDAFDLRDDDAAGVARGHRDREALERQRLALHRDVAVGIGGGAADHADVDRERAVEEVFLVAERHQRDQIFGGGGVDLAAAEARIDERAQPHAREVSRLARGNVAEQMRDHALRQVVGLDLVAYGERLQLGHEAPVSADHALHEARVTQVVEPALLAVALAGRVDERQVARTAHAVRIVLRRLDEAVLERDRDVLGEADADEARRGDRVAVPDQRDGLARGHDLAVLERVQRGDEIGDIGCVHAVPLLQRRGADSAFISPRRHRSATCAPRRDGRRRVQRPAIARAGLLEVRSCGSIGYCWRQLARCTPIRRLRGPGVACSTSSNGPGPYGPASSSRLRIREPRSTPESSESPQPIRR